MVLPAQTRSTQTVPFYTDAKLRTLIPTCQILWVGDQQYVFSGLTTDISLIFYQHIDTAVADVSIEEDVVFIQGVRCDIISCSQRFPNPPVCDVQCVDAVVQLFCENSRIFSPDDIQLTVENELWEPRMVGTKIWQTQILPACGGQVNADDTGRPTMSTPSPPAMRPNYDACCGFRLPVAPGTAATFVRFATGTSICWMSGSTTLTLSWKASRTNARR